MEANSLIHPSMLKANGKINQLAAWVWRLYMAQSTVLTTTWTFLSVLLGHPTPGFVSIADVGLQVPASHYLPLYLRVSVQP